MNLLASFLPELEKTIDKLSDDLSVLIVSLAYIKQELEKAPQLPAVQEALSDMSYAARDSKERIHALQRAYTHLSTS